MDRSLPLGLPPGAIAIARDASGTATAAAIYTVPAGQRLRITHAWAAIGGASAVGAVQLRVNNGAAAGKGILGDLGNARTLVAAACGAGAGSSSDNALSGLDVPLETGTTVDMVLATGAGQIVAGFVGYLDPALPGLVQ